jgi:hypothetical protein
MSWRKGKVIPGNGRPVLAWVFGPDAHAERIASLGAMTNTFSPGARGIHAWPDRAPTGYTGDPGYGVNRWSGRTQFGLQNFRGALYMTPQGNPKSNRLGAGAGVSGQPGLPNTGTQTGAATPWMGGRSMGFGGGQ